MLKAMLIVYVLNSPHQTFVYQEFPSVASCNDAIAVMEKQTNAWTRAGKKIPNHYSADCLPLKGTDENNTSTRLIDQPPGYRYGE